MNRAAESLTDDPRDLAALHTRCRILGVAAQNALDQIALFARVHEKADMSRVIDQRKRERQTPRVELRNEIRDDATQIFLKGGGSRKQRSSVSIVAQAE